MNEPALRIDELRLRVPGLAPRDARQFGEQVARQLAAQLPGAPATRQIGAMHVRLRQPAGVSRHPSPAAIACEIGRRPA